MTKLLLALLKSNEESDHLEWAASLDKYKDDIDYDIIEFSRNDWYEKCLKKTYNLYVCRPPGRNNLFINLYDERTYTLAHVLRKSIYPSYDELVIYENKRMLAYYLAAKRLPHARTMIFYDKTEAIESAAQLEYPLIAKTAIGAGSSGIMKLDDKNKFIDYVQKAFSPTGIMRKWGPNIRKGNIYQRFKTRISDPAETYSYFLNKKKSAVADIQRGYIILQDYVDVKEEWRTVRIGNSYFAHIKLSSGLNEFRSGTSKVGWTAPPPQLLEFLREITETNALTSCAIDIFVDKNNNYLINEIQCFFGSQNVHQMIINGVPGRYLYKSKEWIFQEGNFNTNNSYDLRVQHIISLLE